MVILDDLNEPISLQSIQICIFNGKSEHWALISVKQFKGMVYGNKKKKTLFSWFELKGLWRINLKKKSYVMYWHSPAPDPSVRGSFLGKNTLNLIDTYFFFKFSQNWHTYFLVPPLTPQYMVLLPIAHVACRWVTFPKGPPLELKSAFESFIPLYGYVK